MPALAAEYAAWPTEPRMPAPELVLMMRASTALAGLRLVAPVGGGVAGDGEVALEVHAHHRVPLVLGRVGEHPVAHEAGVVHHRVEAAERVDGGGDDAAGARRSRPRRRRWPRPRRPPRGSRRPPRRPARCRRRVPSSSQPRSFTTTRAPCRASSRAWARPSPRPAPVTITTRPSQMPLMGASMTGSDAVSETWSRPFEDPVRRAVLDRYGVEPRRLPRPRGRGGVFALDAERVLRLHRSSVPGGGGRVRAPHRRPLRRASTATPCPFALPQVLEVHEEDVALVDRAAAARPAPRGATRRARAATSAGGRSTGYVDGAAAFAALGVPTGFGDGFGELLHRRGAAGRPLGRPAGGPARPSSSSSTLGGAGPASPTSTGPPSASSRRRARSRPTGARSCTATTSRATCCWATTSACRRCSTSGGSRWSATPTHDVRSAVAFWAVRPWSRPGDDAALLAAAQRHLGPDAAGLIARTRRFEQLRFAFVAEDPHLHAWCLDGLRALPDRRYGTSTTLPPTLRSCRSVRARTTSSSGYSVGSTGWSVARAGQRHQLGEQRLVALGVSPGPRPPVDADQGAVVEQHLVDRAAAGSRRRRSRSRGSGPSTAARAGRARRSGRPPGRRPRRPRRRSAPAPAP